jgi:WD40 repeat protein
MALLTILAASVAGASERPRADGELIAQATRWCCDNIAFSPDGKQLASAAGGIVTLWDLAAGLEVRTFVPPRRLVRDRPQIPWASENFQGLAFDPSGRYVASTAVDVRNRQLWARPYRIAPPNVWEIDSGRDLSEGEWRFDSEKDRPVGGAISFDSWAPTLWQTTRSAQAVDRLVAYRGRAEAFSIDGRLGARATGDDGHPQSLEVLSLPADRTVWKTVTAHKRLVLGLRFSPDARWLVSSGWDSPRVWDVRSGAEVSTCLDTLQNVTAVAFSEDGRYLAISGSYYIRLVALGRWHEPVDLVVPRFERIGALAFSPDGKTLAAGGGNGIRRWQIPDGRELRTIDVRAALPISALAFSPDGGALVMGAGNTAVGDEAHLVHWPLTEPVPPTRLAMSREDILAVAFSPDGRHLAWTALAHNSANRASGLVEGSARVCEMPVCEPAESLLDSEASPDAADRVGRLEAAAEALAFAPDGGTLFVGAYENTAHTDEDIRFHEFGTRGRLLAFAIPVGSRGLVIETESSRVSDLAVSPDGGLIAAALDGATAALWNRAGTSVSILEPEPGLHHNRYSNNANSVAFSPDGERLAVGLDDGRVLVWTHDAEPSAVVWGDAAPSVRAVRFSPDGRWLAASRCGAFPLRGLPNTIEVWDTRRGTLSQRRTLESGCAQRLAFSPNGWLASVDDGGITIWEPSAMTPRLHLAVLGMDGDWLAWAPDGRFDGTDRAMARLAAVRKGSRAYALDADRGCIRTPGLVVRRLKEAPSEP